MVEKLKRSKLYAVLGQVQAVAMPIMVQIGYFLAGLILSLTTIIGGISPMGLAFVIAVPNCFCLATAAGAVVGYAMGLELLVAAKYLAAVCIVAVLRWVFQHLKSVKILSAAGGLSAVLAISLIYINYLPTYASIPQCFAEAALSAGMGILFSYLPYKHKLDRLDIKQTTAIIVLAVSVLCSLTTVTISVINVGYLAGGVLMLCLAYALSERGAAISAILLMVTAIITSGASLYISAIISLAGLTAAFFCKGERIAFAGVFCVAGFFGLSISPSVSAAAACFATCIFSSVIFLLIPLKLFNIAPAKSFAYDKRQSAYMSQRLNSLASALQDVGTAVEGICEVLWKKKQDVSTPIEYACESLCKGCTSCNHCWVENYTDTMDMLNNSLSCLKSDGYITADKLPSRMAKNCAKLPELCGALNRGFAMYLASKTAGTQAQMLKTALAQQYGAMADTLTQMAGEIWHEERLDTGKTSSVKQLFCEMDLEPLDVAVYEDKTKALRVQVKTERVQINSAQLQAITTEVSHCCNRHFVACEPCHTSGVTSFVFLEKPLFSPVFAQAMIAAKNDVSADVIDYFCDERSNAHLVLCDGMGTGKVASVDGKMAAALSHRLLQAGFSSEGVARLVNVALCLKSSDETGATLDAFSVNLFTGKAIFYKAGAAPSFLIRNKRVEVFSADSLPMGATPTVTGSISSFVMKPNDMVVLVSDGVCEHGDGWIKAQLVRLANQPPQSVADELCDIAAEKAKTNDDISVAVLKLN